MESVRGKTEVRVAEEEQEEVQAEEDQVAAVLLLVAPRVLQKVGAAAALQINARVGAEVIQDV